VGSAKRSSRVGCRFNLQGHRRVRPPKIVLDQGQRGGGTRHYFYYVYFGGSATLLRVKRPVLGNITATQFLCMLQCPVALIVAPRPHEICRSLVCSPPQVPQHPNSRPQTSHITPSRKHHVHLENASSKTELVPPLQHARLEVALHRGVLLLEGIPTPPLCVFSIRGDNQVPITSGDAGGVVVLQRFLSL